MFHPQIESGFLGEVSILGMIFAEVILVLFSWFFIFYSMKAFLQARTKEFAILLHLGMEHRQLGKLVFLETMIIGILSSVAGIIFGFAFSKFFFMIIREILHLNALPLYLSWEPFALTLTVFLSAFIVISFVSVKFSPEMNIMEVLKGQKYVDGSDAHSKRNAWLGIGLILAGYILALLTTKTTIFEFTVFIPILAMFGTYYFFTDSLIYFLGLLKRNKNHYWKKSRILSISEQIQIVRSNAKMFFVVTMVSTMAFLCVGVLSALSSYTSQYDRINPLGMIYKGHIDNPSEAKHIKSLVTELEEQELSYNLTRFTVKRQTSTATSYPVEVFRETDINHLLFSFGYPMVRLDYGEAMFIPASEDDIAKLSKMKVDTVLKESDVSVTIDSVYPQLIFPTSIVSPNAIIVSDEDFVRIVYPFEQYPQVEPGYHLFTFDIPNWMETEKIGLELYQTVAQEYIENDEYSLPFYYENTGLNYSYILATYSLFSVVGILVVAVFLLAAGSFVYFKLYTNLDRERKQFDVLKRIGLTDAELKNLITRYLIPQFFLPWGVALVHSAFAFLAVQKVLNDVLNISIVKEVVFAFSFFVVVQVVYFYLIRWRYIAHVKG